MLVITSPTGFIGRQVLERVVEAGAPVRVVARDPSRLPAAVRERVEVVTGSHGDAATVDVAFAGAEAVFWLVPPDVRAPSVEAAYVDFSRPAVAALRRHGVARAVSVSALGRETTLRHQAGLVTASLAVDDLLAAAVVASRALTMPSFWENLLRQRDPIRDLGAFSGPLPGDVAAPAVATRDIATVAAALLLDHGWGGSAEVPVVGPDDLSPLQMAEVMADVLARPITYQQVSTEAFRAGLTARGASEAMAQGYSDMITAKATGLDVVDPLVPRSATTFRQWCEQVLRPAVLGGPPPASR